MKSKKKRNNTKKLNRKKYSKKKISKKKYSKKKYHKKNMKGGSIGDALAAGAGTASGYLLGLGNMGMVSLGAAAAAGRRAYNNTLCQCNGCISCRRPSNGKCGPASHTSPWKNKWYPHNCCRGRFQNLPGVPQLDINGKCRECNLTFANNLGYPTFQEYLEAKRVYSHGPGPHNPRWRYIERDERGIPLRNPQRGADAVVGVENILWVRRDGQDVPLYVYRSYPHYHLYPHKYRHRDIYKQMEFDGFEYAGSEEQEMPALEEAKAEREINLYRIIHNVLDNWKIYIKEKQDRRQHMIEYVLRRFKEKANLEWLPFWWSRWENEELPDIKAQNPDITEEELNERMKRSKEEFKASLQ